MPQRPLESYPYSSRMVTLPLATTPVRRCTREGSGCATCAAWPVLYATPRRARRRFRALSSGGWSRSSGPKTCASARLTWPPIRSNGMARESRRGRHLLSRDNRQQGPRTLGQPAESYRPLSVPLGKASAVCLENRAKCRTQSWFCGYEGGGRSENAYRSSQEGSLQASWVWAVGRSGRYGDGVVVCRSWCGVSGGGSGDLWCAGFHLFGRDVAGSASDPVRHL
jgi:hypothetical protein